MALRGHNHHQPEPDTSKQEQIRPHGTYLEQCTWCMWIIPFHGTRLPSYLEQCIGISCGLFLSTEQCDPTYLEQCIFHLDYFFPRNSATLRIWNSTVHISFGLFFSMEQGYPMYLEQYIFHLDYSFPRNRATLLI